MSRSVISVLAMIGAYILAAVGVWVALGAEITADWQVVADDPTLFLGALAGVVASGIVGIMASDSH